MAGVKKNQQISKRPFELKIHDFDTENILIYKMGEMQLFSLKKARLTSSRFVCVQVNNL